MAFPAKNKLSNLLLTTIFLSLAPTLTQSQCSLDAAINAGNVSFNDAIRGEEIKIAMYNDGLPFTDYDSATNTFVGGFSIDIINALVDIAGFIPNITLLTFQAGESYTDAAQRALLTNDLAGSWFTDAASRRLLNMNFAHHFVDATLVLIIPTPTYQVKKFSMTAFLKPFTAGLWLLIVSGIIFNGICTFLFYILSSPATRSKCKQCLFMREAENVRELFSEFGSSVATSFGHFTAAGDGFEPTNTCSRINTIMWSFLVVIVLASYTANLATALIAEATVADSLDTVEAILSAGKSICTVESGIEGERVRKRYPTLTIVDAYYDSGEFLRNSTCAGALLGATDAAMVLAKNCDMQLTVQRMFPSGGSFVFHNDEERCGSTIQKIFDYYMVTLEEEGTLDELWAQQVDDNQCEFEAPQAPERDADDIQLSLYDLGGLSAIYAIVAVGLLGLNVIVVVFCEKKKIDDNKDVAELTTQVQNNTELKEDEHMI